MIERKHPLAECEECPLIDDGFCPSSGPEKADIVIVGEAPGFKETKTGEPFTGQSGQLLSMVLRNYGIERNDVFLTNTVLCRPEGNANPPAAAIKACGNRLRSEIERRSPKTIVAVGNFASKRILDTQQGITQTRVGPPKTSKLWPGVRIIPTFHPAAALYNQGVFPDIVTDFAKIKGGVSVSPTWTKPEFEVIGDYHRAERVLRDIGSQPCAIDIEVGIEKDIDFDHPERYRFLCIGIAASETTGYVFDEALCQTERFRVLFGGWLQRALPICHNGKFDLAGLWGWGHGQLYFDTMIASYVMDERGTGIHGLEYNAIEHLGSPSWKHELGHYLGPDKNYGDIPRPVLYRYNAYDVVNTYRLFEQQRTRLDAEGLRGLHDFLVEASGVLMSVERNGLHVDEDYLDELTKTYQEDLNELKHNLQQIVEDPGYNPNSWQQVTEVLQNQFNQRVKNTRKETLVNLQERAARRGDTALYDFLVKHLQFKKDSKSYGTYVKGTRKRLYEGRVHSTFLIHGTTTGRLASRNPNLQNVTRGSTLRRLFIPGSSTRVLGQADYRQAEFRVVCTLARDPYLRDVFSDDTRNIHEEVGRHFYGDDFSRRDKEKYIRAKAVVFGLLYGREAFSLAAEHKMPVSEAQEYIDTFMGLIPQVVEWRENVVDQVRAGEDLLSPFNRHRRFWLITDSNKHNVFKEAYAFLPQSTASDLTLAAGIRLASEGYADLLRIPVHDAWVFECEKSDAWDVGEHIGRVMTEVAEERLGDYVAFPTDVGFGNSWGEIT